MKSDFLSLIYDNAPDVWKLIENIHISLPVKELTGKQKEVLFLTAVRLCTSQQIACYKEKIDRAIRKPLTAALESIRGKLGYTLLGRSK